MTDNLSASQQKFIAPAIILPSIGLSIWSTKMLEQTFISDSHVLLTILGGGAAGITIMYFVWKKYNFPIGVMLFYGFVLGMGISLFIFSAGNYYFKSSRIVETVSPILKIGKNTRRFRTTCASRYAVVQYENIGNKVKFTCRLGEALNQYKQVRLELSKGFFGYYVIRKYELIKPDEGIISPLHTSQYSTGSHSFPQSSPPHSAPTYHSE